ncbi:tryptophan synthase subunit alpha [Arachnia propionica]|uniref:Tryptophan synthase alpha chain n=1 Tax=Arachnia propionica TaxID=1750 RepID=A0A3P1TCT6_9ACTN|nr:tryptophan synthase subunit alpha [Arachnia propionica]RRD07239.1 tryptophan synthase subunit alpha [Arachnia propionica]
MKTFTDTARLGISGRVIASCRDEGRAALVGYLPVGYPSVADSMAAYRVLCEGADIVEIGMPYTDPFLDGTVIQHATTRALQRGVRTRHAFTAAETVAACGRTPVVMTYWNLIEQYGPDAFARDLAAAGGAGVITPDLTPDEADEWVAATDAHSLDRIFLIAPSSTPERISMTMTACRGWVYATSVMGVTGVRATTSVDAPVIAGRAREIDPGLPIGIGLGVGTGAQAAEVATWADAVIVGSALVRCLGADGDDLTSDLQKLSCLTAELSAGVKQ